MYEISSAFREAMHNFIIEPKLRGTIDGIPFTHDDVLEGSFRCRNQCVSVKNIKVGGVFLGEIQFTLLKSVANTRGNWYGREITCEYGLHMNGITEFIPCPSYRYTVNEATWTEQGLKIVAYDNMLKLDKNYFGEQASGQPWYWLNYISSKTGVQLGITQEEVEAMPNGTMVIGLYNLDNIETYRDVLSYLCQVLGGYATINRNGALVVRHFKNVVVDVIDAQSRFAGCSFSDYTTKYTGLSVVNSDDNTTSYYHTNPDDGLTMNLGTNPFLQYGSVPTKLAMRLNILNSLNEFEYVPFKATMLGCCAYDLGDCIKFVGGIADRSVGCIMLYDFGLNDYSIGGYGDNPALESARSKTDKNIAGLSKSQTSEALSVTNLTNISEVDIGQDWNKVGSVAFNVNKQQTVLFHAVSKHSLNSDGTIRYKYKINGNDFDFIHEVFSHSGVDTTTLFIPFTAEPNIPVLFEVYVQSDDSTGTVEAINMRGAIIGAGVIGADWDGTLSFEDAFNFVNIGTSTFDYVVSDISVDTQTPIGGSFNDVFNFSNIGTATFGYTEEIRVTTRNPVFKRITEDRATRITEDGNIRIT